MDPILSFACLIITGITAGTASGLFGVGGGFLMTPVQYWLSLSGGMDSTLATRLAFGTSLAVMLPTMISGAAAHHSRGAVNWKAAIPMGCAAIFGGLAGGTLAAHLPGIVLRTFFAILIIVMAARMVWHIRSCPVCEPRGSTGIYILIGFLIGIVSGLAGIGGGILLVPVLVILLGYSMHTAVGTSSACLIFSSAGAVTAYVINGWGVAGLPLYSIGYVDLLTFAILAATTIPLARLGVRCAHGCSDRKLQIVFAGMLILIGLLMLVEG
ncbi:MAG: sulfite exporter TauE/SafE family protein [Methanoregula sp.]|nr:sulfite exporter TauE/SafE family protein [Methanoregula sp.]